MNFYKIIHERADQLLLLRSLQPRYELRQRQVAAVQETTEQGRLGGEQAAAGDNDQEGEEEQQQEGKVGDGAVSLSPSSLYLVLK